MKSLLYIFLSITLGGLLTTPMPVLAKTPDGDTPANEGVCDDLKAASVTKGLYGLCVAFCEAHDAADISEAISSDDLAELLASRPNGKILANYNEKKSASDPDMPCLRAQEPCPCWELADLDRILFTRTDSSNYCWESDWPGTWSYFYTYITEFDAHFSILALAYDFRDNPNYQPYYGDGACNWIINDAITGEYRYSYLDHLDAETTDACITQIQDRYAAVGVTSCDGYQ